MTYETIDPDDPFLGTLQQKLQELEARQVKRREQMERLEREIATDDEQIVKIRDLIEVNLRTSPTAAADATIGQRSLRRRAGADEAVNLIREQGSPMHYQDIFRELVARGYEIGGKGNADTLLSRYFNDSRLERVARGTYGLRNQPLRSRPTTINEPLQPSPDNRDAKRAKQRQVRFDPEQPADGSLDVFIDHPNGLSARGRYRDEQVTVLAGSQAAKQIKSYESSQATDSAIRMQQKLIAGGELVDGGECYEFTSEVTLSLSTAAMLVVGGSANGWDVWRDRAGRKLNQIISRKRPQ